MRKLRNLMALFVLLYAVVAPFKLLPHVRTTNQKPCKSNIQCQNCKVLLSRLDICFFCAILRKTNIEWGFFI